MGIKDVQPDVNESSLGQNYILQMALQQHSIAFFLVSNYSHWSGVILWPKGRGVFWRIHALHSLIA